MAVQIDPSLAKSLGLHLAIVVVLIAGTDFSSKPEMVSVTLESEGKAPVEAVAIDQQVLDARVKQIQQERDAAKAAEEKRIRDLERRAQQAEKSRTAEEARLKRVAEEKRKADAEAKKAKAAAAEAKKRQEQENAKAKEAEQARIAKEQERKKAEEAAKAAEQKRKAEQEAAEKAAAERERKAELARQQAEQERAMQEQLAKEAQARAAARAKQAATEVQRYTALIRDAIQRNLLVDESMRGKSARINIRLASNGFVTNVGVISGDKTVCDAAVRAGLNVIVSGATQAGKTTLMNALLNSAPSSERVITCEEVFELQLTSPDWVALQTRQASLEGTGEIPLRRLIKEALRMLPSRLVVGEVRQEEALDLLVAMNAGMPSMCSLHANGSREAISKLCLLPMLAGSNVSAEFVVPTVASVVDIVVHTALRSDGTRRVQQITSVTGRVEGNSIETGDVFSFQNERLEPQGIFPGRLERFQANNIDLTSLVGASQWV